MNTERNVLVIALFAAFADGNKHDREREHLRSLADSLGKAADLPGLYQDVLLKRVSLDQAVSNLADAGERQLAYEIALGVCEADGKLSEAERAFLGQLKALLQLDYDEARRAETEADAIESLSSMAAPVTTEAGTVVASQPDVPEAELDKTILNTSLLAGALELLPQSWAPMAIIPLQIKMVYSIGKAHGYPLDQGHIKDFIAAAGVGLTSQYLEQFGRKLLGGLIGKAAGKTMGKIGNAATGMAFSFATTYALGQLAKHYYAGGRAMNAAVLKETFQNLLGPAGKMQTQYLPQIQQRAATLDMSKIMEMVRH
jgi:uncharacterized protein (DUF697 family)/tellurite resistance protein